jgi:hypothetical protein
MNGTEFSQKAQEIRQYITDDEPLEARTVMMQMAQTLIRDAADGEDIYYLAKRWCDLEAFIYEHC